MIEPLSIERVAGTDEWVVNRGDRCISAHPGKLFAKRRLIALELARASTIVEWLKDNLADQYVIDAAKDVAYDIERQLNALGTNRQE